MTHVFLYRKVPYRSLSPHNLVQEDAEPNTRSSSSFPCTSTNKGNMESKRDTSVHPRDMPAGPHGHTLRDVTRKSHLTAMLRYGVAKVGTAFPVGLTSTLSPAPTADELCSAIQGLASSVGDGPPRITFVASMEIIFSKYF